MTENEAKEWLAEDTSPTLIHIAELKKENPMVYINKAVNIACDALEEIQQYRAIGTIEEFKDLKEKSEPKKPIELDNWGEYWKCPTCDNYVVDNLGCRYKFCPNCGTKIDWQ